MTAEVIELRPIVSAVEQAKKLGVNATMAVIRRVRQDQRQGLDGKALAYELQRQRLLGDFEPNPPAGAA